MKEMDSLELQLSDEGEDHEQLHEITIRGAGGDGGSGAAWGGQPLGGKRSPLREEKMGTEVVRSPERVVAPVAMAVQRVNGPMPVQAGGGGDGKERAIAVEPVTLSPSTAGERKKRAKKKRPE